MANINTKIKKENATFIFEATLEKTSYEYEIEREALILEGYEEVESDRIFATYVKRISINK